MKLLTAGLAGLGVVLASTLVATPVLLHQASSDTRPSTTRHADEPGKGTGKKAEEKAEEKAQKKADKKAHDVPPGLAKKGVTEAPGPAGQHGQGHGWGRAHAPGQHKDKGEKSGD